jgi:BirA family biotin operon repressor/biotin-[acetyl-CoA-carboxylase] ligase
MAWNKDSVVHLLEVDSTNRYVRDEAAVLWKNRGTGDFAIVTAGHQTAGRGQRGNTWNSNAGENLLFSILVRPGETLEVSKQFLLSQAVALSIHDAMKCHGIDTQVKWPNDIYAGNRKLAGILLELDYSGAFVEQAIIGIGLNVNQENFPPMDRVPVSMKMLLGRNLGINDVLATALEFFEHYYSQMLYGNREALAAEYSRLLLGYKELRSFVDSEARFDAVIEGVEGDGHLLLRRSDGTLSRYAFKEVEQLL